MRLRSTPPPGCDVVLTTDGAIAGVHFFADDPPDTIGRKALGMNLSDLAAKGARPLGFLLALALSAAADGAWLKAFAAGLGAHFARVTGTSMHCPNPLQAAGSPISGILSG
jgi:thiamine-monophosphate kinase